ncbi:flagellar basal body rod protein FlgC [Alkalibacter mobilis]|uniref:flagellar basal body rod protein FlgC n=1 Tax=Alkalibacter mobilis TaxID=2787712 RepID=UPI00189E5115|nr:flagellar basal body rod protein FlgC [Alkalibacter mobilis]MBF7096326.1 flagellar basal body rod protein FlgC [Alkalibacter mobilis]
MSVFNSMKINASGLTLERLKLDTISSNIANVNTTRTEEGGPYQRKEVAFQEMVKDQYNKYTKRQEEVTMGVKVTGILEDPDNMRLVYDPNHPDADDEGYVTMPNVNLLDEMVGLIEAQRSYEANATALKASKAMLNKAVEISKG